MRYKLSLGCIAMATALGAVMPAAALAHGYSQFSIYVGPGEEYYDGYDGRAAWVEHERWEAHRRWEARRHWEEEQARRQYWDHERWEHHHEDGNWNDDD